MVEKRLPYRPYPNWAPVQLAVLKPRKDPSYPEIKLIVFRRLETGTFETQVDPVTHTDPSLELRSSLATLANASKAELEVEIVKCY